MKGERLFKKAMVINSQLYSDYKSLDDVIIIMKYREYINLIKKAAYMGHAEAQFQLALHYEDSNYFGVNPDYDREKTKYWYTKACDGGDGTACNNLGSMILRDGNIELGMKLLKRAVELGYDIAQESYAELLKEQEEAREGVKK